MNFFIFFRNIYKGFVVLQKKKKELSVTKTNKQSKGLRTCCTKHPIKKASVFYDNI